MKKKKMSADMKAVAKHGKIEKKMEAEGQNGGSQPPKKNSGNTMYDFKNLHTGTNATHPGVLKAQADKKKADANLAAYKKKVYAEKAAAIKKAQENKYAQDANLAAYKKKIDAQKAAAIKKAQK